MMICPPSSKVGTDIFHLIIIAIGIGIMTSIETIGAIVVAGDNKLIPYFLLTSL